MFPRPTYEYTETEINDKLRTFLVKLNAQPNKLKSIFEDEVKLPYVLAIRSVVGANLAGLTVGAYNFYRWFKFERNKPSAAVFEKLTPTEIIYAFLTKDAHPNDPSFIRPGNGVNSFRFELVSRLYDNAGLALGVSSDGVCDTKLLINRIINLTKPISETINSPGLSTGPKGP